MGGLGPYGHIELERRLLTAVERRLGRPPRDQEYPSWVLISKPDVPDRTTAIVEAGPSPVDALVECLTVLDAAADFAVIACNTAHTFLPQLRTRLTLPILDMVRETIRHVADHFGPTATVGVLATTGTLASGVFAQAASSTAPGVRVLTPSDLGLKPLQARALQERVVMGAIFGRTTGEDDFCGGVKGGAHNLPAVRERITAELRGVVDLFRSAGASAVIVGCTELSLVMGEAGPDSLPVIDPLDIIADAALDVASGARPLPE